MTKTKKRIRYRSAYSDPADQIRELKASIAVQQKRITAMERMIKQIKKKL